MRRAVAFSLLAMIAVANRADAQSVAGPHTSGGSLPYIAAGQSEEEILKRRKAKQEAEKARLEAEKAAAPVAVPVVAPSAPPAEPAPAPAAAKVDPAPVPAIKSEPAKPEIKTAAQPAPDGTATIPPATAAKPKVAKAKPVDGTLPPGLEPVDAAALPPKAVRPQSLQNLPRLQEGTVVVYRPAFFGLFGPSVPVTERATVVVPPAPIGRTQPPPGPVFATQKPRPAQPGTCHYHAYPTSSGTHRDVQCHLHADPSDPSLRYVQ